MTPNFSTHYRHPAEAGVQRLPRNRLPFLDSRFRGKDDVGGEEGSMADLDAEYVIVGAGSAGCVLADRLSEDGAQVVLLEAGPTD